LDTAKYIPAAQIYAQCSKPFEEVVLGFIDRGERDALRYYLISRLERLKRQVGSLLFLMCLFPPWVLIMFILVCPCFFRI
jgi:hypothetical protein